MGEHFRRFKRRLRLFAELGAVLIGISAGALSVGIAMLTVKLSFAVLAWYWYAVIGAGAFAAAYLISRFALVPSDRRVAKKLDGELELKERVQTMLQFRDTEGEMLEIQRRDTEERLSVIPSRSVPVRHVIPCIAACLVAVSVLVGAFFTPVRSLPDNGDKSEGETDVWALAEWQEMKVLELIEEVRKSGLDEDGKTKVITALEGMLSDLRFVNTVTVMKRTVINAMIRIDGTVDGINTFTRLLTALEASGSPRVKEYAVAIGTPSDPITESKYQALKAELSASDVILRAESLAEALTEALVLAELPSGDALYLAVSGLASELAALAEGGGALSDTEAAAFLAESFDAAAQTVSIALGQQNVNRTVSDDTNNELMSIFGVKWDELPEELRRADHSEAGTNGGDYEERDDEIITDGGLGGGEVIYGSNDAVFDPDSQTHVKYGDIIDGYDAKKTSELSEKKLSDRLKQFIEKYFAGLYYTEEEN